MKEQVKLELQPLTLAEARRFIEKHHRHNVAPVGCKFCIGLNDGQRIVGVAVVGRPIAQAFDDGWTAEVTRVCVLDGYKNACSMLYGACWRAAKAMGYRRLYTYTRSDEPGTSLRAAGWNLLASRRARSWAKESGRPRVDTTDPHQRKLWSSV